MEVDRCFVVISVPIPASEAFDFFDLAVDALTQGIRYPVAGIGHNIVQMRFETLGRLDHRLEPRVGRPEVPPSEVSPHPAFFLVLPEMAEVIFDSTSTANLEVQ